MSLLQNIKFILFPFALIYWLIIYIRNTLYDNDIFKSIEFDFPVICIGNLSFGGTGKTPHVEYLIRLLSNQFRVTILSRGYKRKSTGYLAVQANSDVEQVGDEPALIKKKYPHVGVAVSEDREMAVPQIISTIPTDVIVLDDAFQHRSIRAGMSIVLTKYNKLFTRDYILPIGSLREYRGAYKRADFIIVSKCPKDLTKAQKQAIKEEINPQKGQLVFFSYIDYFPAYSITDHTDRLQANKELDILLFSGIASSSELKEFLEKSVRNLYSLDYHDHHDYDRVDMENITEAFNNIESPNKVLMTTEKDAVRLYKHRKWIIDKKLPIYVLPIKVEFFKEDKQLFDSEVVNYLERLKNLRS